MCVYSAHSTGVFPEYKAGQHSDRLPQYHGILALAQTDPSDFVLGAFLIHTKEAVMVAKTMQHVANFAANRTAYMTFNYTSLPENRDCILLAWLPDAEYVSDIFHHTPIS